MYAAKEQIYNYVEYYNHVRQMKLITFISRKSDLVKKTVAITVQNCTSGQFNPLVPDAHYIESPDKQVSLQIKLIEATL